MPTAVITGAAGGMASGFAAGFRAAGYEVVAIDRVAADGVVALDVTDTAAVKKLAATIDRLDVLVNAAGVLRRTDEYEVDVFANVLDINLTGGFRLATALKPALMKAKGSIINVASMYAIFGAPHAPAYAASKGGVVQLTKSLAVAWAKDGIRVNAVAPGWIITPMAANARADEARSRAIVERTPMGRWGTPDDVLGPVLFLASEAARFVTGVVLPVDGGYSVMKKMPAPADEKDKRTPYRLPQPAGMAPDLVVAPAIPDDDRIWVPQAPDVWFRPLVLSVAQGYWVNLLKVTRSGVLSRHRHTNPVHGYVLKGRWHYLEHDWVAEEGGYVYEPPGETHTLVVPDGVAEMITLFQVNGIMLYVDPDGNAQGYEDVFTKIEMCRKHYAACGLGAGYVDQFIR